MLNWCMSDCRIKELETKLKKAQGNGAVFWVLTTQSMDVGYSE